MFTEIRATNFKSWARLTPDVPADDAAQISSPGLPLGKVTGLFGPNSAGKSSVLQVPLLLKQTAESSDRRSPLDLGDARSPVRLDSFGDVLRGHDLHESLGLGLTWTVDEPIRFVNRETEHEGIFSAHRVAFDTEVVSRRDLMGVRRFQYQGSGGNISCESTTSESSEYSVNANLDHIFGYRLVSSKRAPMMPVKCYGFPEQAPAQFVYGGLLQDLEFSFEEALRRIYYLGPLREVPQSTYSWTGAPAADVGSNGAAAVQALLTTQKGGLRTNYRTPEKDGQPRQSIGVEQHVAAWLRELGLLHSFRVAPIQQGANIYRVYVKRYESSPEVLLTDIGFGVSQVLPVLVLLAYAPEGSTVILEQPEIHLHPAVQSGLADVILETALVRNVQVIVESHSEHLLKRIQLRVAEQQLENGTGVSADDVHLWFIDQEGPESRASDLRINEYGEIMNWPDNFFGDPFTETARIAKAALRRRRRAADS
jgi:predicted ATPase